MNFCNSETLTKDSISFRDGNVWIKKTGTIDGVYTDPNHPEGYRVVRDAGNAKLSIELSNRPDRSPYFLTGVVNKKEGKAVIDFSPLGGPKKFSADISDGKLVFSDGNAWTKL